MTTSKDGRPKPPRDLTKTQRKHWNDIVANEASSTFETVANQNLLVELVRNLETSGFLSKAIAKIEAEPFDPENVKNYADLLKLREIATRTIASLETKLRVTNQSRYTPQSAATASKYADSPDLHEFTGEA